MSADPPASINDVTFTDGQSLEFSEFSSWTDFVDYCFLFNGSAIGAQMRLDAPDRMHSFGIDKAPAPTLLDIGGGSGFPVGLIKYRIRFVRELEERVREYWGAKSESASITTIATSIVRITWTPPTNSQITHVYVERTLPGLEEFYYVGRVAASAGVYNDSAATDTGQIDDDTLPTPTNIRYAANDSGSLFIVDKDLHWYGSVVGKPQEFNLFNNELITDGSGDLTGLFSFQGAIFVVREKGIMVFNRNPFGDYTDPTTVIQGWGCVAPNSIKVIRAGKINFVTFFDDNEGPCILTEQGIYSLKRIESGGKIISDVVDIVDNQIDPNYRKYVAVGYKNNCIYWWYTPIGSTTNTKCIIYDASNGTWSGPDIGYPTNCTFTRLSNKGVYGSGELLGAYDADNIYVTIIDANYSRDFGNKIIMKVDSMAIGADAMPWDWEFMKLAFYGRLSYIFRIDVSVPAAVIPYAGSYYSSPKPYRYYMDNGTLIDSGATFDAVVQSLMDHSIFDHGDLMDTMKDDEYTFDIDSLSAQGPFMYLSLYDEDSSKFEIGRIRILGAERGERS